MDSTANTTREDRSEPRKQGKFGPAPEELGPYRIESLVGSGGMGAVYRARDERLDRVVAIKYVRADNYDNDNIRQRFHREARAAAQVNHPAIVQIFDFVQEDDADWIVMEFVDGRTLSTLLKEDGPCSLATGLPVLREVAYGLAEAHRHNVVHRDIKTDNVMITRDGRVKITDFGVARRILADDPMDRALTLDGMIIGTPHAMSPEQANGTGVDHRTDLFSFGSLAYETLTGVVPFRASNPIKVLYQVCTHQQAPAHELNPGIPEDLSRAIDRLLAKDPADRPQDVREVARLLDRLAGLEVSGYFALVLDGPQQVDDPDAPIPPTQAAFSIPAPTAELLAAETRQVALLHSELGVAGLFDAEDLASIRPIYHQILAEVRSRFGGTDAETSDRVCRVLFGDTAARGDEVRRAIGAAREISRLAAQRLPRDGALALRSAVHTGTAVVDGTSVFLGQTGDVAAALVQGAAPGSLAVSPQTLPLLRSHFEVRQQGEVRLAGSGDDVEVWRVLGPRRMLEPAVPFFGRRQELEILNMAWRWVGLGRGQAVVVSGQRGIGKSQLLAHFCQQANVEPLVCRAASADAGTPLATLNRLLTQAVVLARENEAEASSPTPVTQGPRAADLENLARYLNLTSEEIVPLLADQLGLPHAGELPEMESEERQGRIFEATATLLTELAHRQPLVLLAEDLHWADPESRLFFDLLVNHRLSRARILIVLTIPPELKAPWKGAHITPIALRRLPEEHSQKLINELHGLRLAPGRRGWIARLAAGVPALLEELTRAAVADPETISPDGDPAALPALVREILQPQIDALNGHSRVLLRLCSVQEITPESLSAITGATPEVCRSGIEELVDAGILKRDEDEGETTYAFRDGLLRQAVAASLTRAARRQLHTKVAQSAE